MRPLDNEFAKLLNKALRDQDRSASWLARNIDVSPTTIHKWLNEYSKPRNPEIIYRIYEVLKIKDDGALARAAGVAYSKPNLEIMIVDIVERLKAAEDSLAALEQKVDSLITLYRGGNTI